MGIVFHLRGDSLDAHRSFSGKSPHLFYENGTVQPALAAHANAINSNAIDISHASLQRAVVYPGINNWPATRQLSILIRIIPFWTGNPPKNMALANFLNPFGVGSYGGILFYLDTSGRFKGAATSENILSINANGTLASSIGAVSGTPMDLFFVTSGLSTGDDRFTGWINGVLGVENSASNNISLEGGAEPIRDNKLVTGMMFGGRNAFATATDLYIDEVVIWDEIIDPTSVQLTDDSVASLNGPSRSLFVKSTALDGSAFTVPVASDVRSGTALVDAGVADVGELESVEIVTDSLGVSLAGGPLTAELE